MRFSSKFSSNIEQNLLQNGGVLLALVVLLPACDGLSRDGSSAEEAPEEVGAEVEVPTSRSGGEPPVAGQGEAPTDVSVAPPAAEPRLVYPGIHPVTEDGRVLLNETVRQDGRGFQLHLFVDGDLDYGPNESVRFELRVKNVAGEPRHLDSGEQDLFLLVPAGQRTALWAHSLCLPSERFLWPPTQLEPGHVARFLAEYPGPRRTPGEDCRVSPGEYDVVGRIASCPPDARVPGESDRPYCDPKRTVKIQSYPVRITLT